LKRSNRTCLQLTRLLFLHAQTSLHPGAGTALGVVDLPIQRERHTQWPLVPASSLKGVLRDACRPESSDSSEYPQWLAVFGPETADADKHAGALTVTDARILAFPVRSLRGVFAWVTCPAVLERLNRDLALGGSNGIAVPRALKGNELLCAEDSPLLLSDKKSIVLEEFQFERSGELGDPGQQLAKQVTDATALRKLIGKHLAVIADDRFTHFVRHATEVVARIGLDYERKTVKQGALFYQEFLPPETLLYAVLVAQPSRRENTVMDAEQVLAFAEAGLQGGLLQIGGDETTGKGLCRVYTGTEG